MNTVNLYEFNSESAILSCEFVRYGINSNNLSVTLTGDFNATANSLKKNKLYALMIESEDVEGQTFYVRFVSYVCQHSISLTQTNTMVVTDNTILFEVIEV